MNSIANLDCNMYCQITLAQVTLPNTVMNTVKIFAMYSKIYDSGFNHLRTRIHIVANSCRPKHRFLAAGHRPRQL